VLGVAEGVCLVCRKGAQAGPLITGHTGAAAVVPGVCVWGGGCCNDESHEGCGAASPQCCVW
jgi:hypothetical protein